jgi:hypothetical protein
MNITEYSRGLLGNKHPKTYHGFFSQWGETFIAIYGIGKRLFLIVNHHLFEINRRQIIEVSGPKHARSLKIIKDNEIVFETRYSLKDLNQPIPEDPTPFIDDEDFDIGLLASNISKSMKRRTIFTDK